MGGFNRQYNVFVPVIFAHDNRKLTAVIRNTFIKKLKDKLGEDISTSIVKTAIRRANAIMHNVMKNSSHNGYVTNNINRSLAHHVGRVTYKRFRHNTPLEERSRIKKNARSLLNTRTNNNNNFYTPGNYNTGVLVRYSVNPRKRRVNDM